MFYILHLAIAYTIRYGGFYFSRTNKLLFLSCFHHRVLIEATLTNIQTLATLPLSVFNYITFNHTGRHGVLLCEKVMAKCNSRCNHSIEWLTLCAEILFIILLFCLWKTRCHSSVDSVRLIHQLLQCITHAHFIVLISMFVCLHQLAKKFWHIDT